MANPKSISVQQLSGAVHKAVANVKVPAGTAGPYTYINPGVICGLIYYGPVAAGANLAPKYIICGFKLPPEAHVHY
jgi:hypothetical protein